MLRLRQIPSVRSPVSASLSMRIICSVARLVFFIDDVLSLIDENHLIKSGLVRGVPTRFKALILEHPDKIAKNLVEKVLTYATGASIEFADRREIARIVDSLENEDYGFRSLIHASVQSSIFQSK